MRKYLPMPSQVKRVEKSDNSNVIHKHAGGRPSIYNQNLVEEILRFVEDGESLRYIADQKGMPDRDTIRRWLRDNKEFYDQYARAKQEQADMYADTITEIAKGTLRGAYDPQAARVAIDAYKWTASKLKPKKYGDKLDLTSNGKDMPSPILMTLIANDITDGMIEGEIVDNDEMQIASNSNPNRAITPTSTPHEHHKSTDIINDINI